MLRSFHPFNGLCYCVSICSSSSSSSSICDFETNCDLCYGENNDNYQKPFARLHDFICTDP